MAALARTVEGQHGGDDNYLQGQITRYMRAAARIAEVCPAGGKVLDIGSHYLHQSVLLRELGYEVVGMDIGLFAEAGFVVERARRHDIQNFAVNAIESGEFLPGLEGQFDLIVFTEILEHITFNPVRFWARVYELLKPGGVIYLSTPNALRPAAFVRQLLDLLRLRGIGIGLDEIMGSVTYGHHWKEYSAWEIRRYFALLSPDFDVGIRWYSSESPDARGVKALLKRAIAKVPMFRSDIEAVIVRRGSLGFSARPPQLPMHATPA
ncbi:class I SAM-dependent methyltransferase [Rivibacter subsaxonicus]|uniref:class I SAM-dependent methyltransferase n=1 Tax=Rivibacter subsaxonicus TaxID=457575 RepID=UPI0013EE4195|nr:class I SAM-dependent methyltransferase [Rivibacter subsaxonicus]